MEIIKKNDSLPEHFILNRISPFVQRGAWVVSFLISFKTQGAKCVPRTELLNAPAGLTLLPSASRRAARKADSEAM
jgi:hypothetical protein